jgi:hypothetical protein
MEQIPDSFVTKYIIGLVLVFWLVVMNVITIQDQTVEWSDMQVGVLLLAIWLAQPSQVRREHFHLYTIFYILSKVARLCNKNCKQEFPTFHELAKGNHLTLVTACLVALGWMEKQMFKGCTWYGRPERNTQLCFSAITFVFFMLQSKFSFEDNFIQISPSIVLR